MRHRGKKDNNTGILLKVPVFGAHIPVRVTEQVTRRVFSVAYWEADTSTLVGPPRALCSRRWDSWLQRQGFGESPRVGIGTSGSCGAARARQLAWVRQLDCRRTLLRRTTAARCPPLRFLQVRCGDRWETKSHGK